MCLTPDLTADGGPDQEWYLERALELGLEHPAARVLNRATHRELARRAAAERAAELEQALAEWACPVCGGPKVCPDLAATLPYRACGYAEGPDRQRWIHA